MPQMRMYVMMYKSATALGRMLSKRRFVAGKICFIASQIVGPEGKVIGVDMTDDMLDLARSNAPVIAERVGYANVEFKRGHIEDLKLDLDGLNEWLYGTHGS